MVKIIIIGLPGRGKTTLAGKIHEAYPQCRMVSINGLRHALGIHYPHHGTDTEIADKDQKMFFSIIDQAMTGDCIVEGYGISPENAEKLAEKHNATLVMLTHESVSDSKDMELAKQYDGKNKWTRNRTDAYLTEMFAVYKAIENKWKKGIPDAQRFDTSKNFEATIQAAYDYIIKDQKPQNQ